MTAPRLGLQGLEIAIRQALEEASDEFSRTPDMDERRVIGAFLKDAGVAAAAFADGMADIERRRKASGFDQLMGALIAWETDSAGDPPETFINVVRDLVAEYRRPPAGVQIVIDTDTTVPRGDRP